MKRLEQIGLGVVSCVVFDRFSKLFESKKAEYAEINRLTLNYEAQLDILKNKSQKDNLLIDQLFSKIQEAKLQSDILSNEVMSLENQMLELSQQLKKGDLSEQVLNQKLKAFQELFDKLVDKQPSQLFKDMAFNNPNIPVPFPKHPDIILQETAKIIPRYKDGVLMDITVDILRSSLEFYKYSFIELYIPKLDYLWGFQVLMTVVFVLALISFCLHTLSNLIKKKFIKLFNGYLWISYISYSTDLYSNIFKRIITFILAFCVFFDIIRFIFF